MASAERRRAQPDVESVAADLSLVDHLLLPASVHDATGRFVHVNALVERVLGRPNAYWVGRQYSDPIPKSARPLAAEQFRRVVEHGLTADFETRLCDHQGRTHHARAQYLPLRSVGVLILLFAPPLTPAGIHPVPEPRLTRRQLEVLELLAAGRSSAEIAQTLTVSGETVRNHVRGLLKALRAHSRIEAVATARRLGLLASRGLDSRP